MAIMVGFVALQLHPSAATPNKLRISTLAGVAPGAVNAPGTAARFSLPIGIRVDRNGNVYVADEYAIRKISSTGTVTTYAGSGGGLGYGILSAPTQVGGVARFAIDSAGNLFFSGSNTVQKLTPAGVLTDLVPRYPQPFGSTNGIALDSAGNVFVVDRQRSTVSKITPSGVLTVFAGSGNFGSGDGTGTQASFFLPEGLAVDSHDNLFVADGYSSTIRKITPTGVVTTFAGKAGLSGTANGTGDAARFGYPIDVAVDSSDNVYVADFLFADIRKITPDGVVTWFAGNGGRGNADGDVYQAKFNEPQGVAVGPDGSLYVCDTGNKTIRKVSPDRTTSTLAGMASAGSSDGTGTNAQFNLPLGVSVDPAGNLYVADRLNNLIRKITPAGAVTTLAGGYVGGTSNLVNGVGTAARFYAPFDTALDAAGNVYVADAANNVIRRVSPSGDVTTYAGTPYTGANHAGEANPGGSTDGPAASAEFYSPVGVAVDASGNVYVSDRENHTIRKITPGGVVSTLAGLARTAGSADGTGSAARFNFPEDVAVDSAGFVYVSDRVNSTVRKISPAGVVTTLAGTAGQSGFDDGVGGAARFVNITGIATDAASNVYVSDNYTVRLITPGGVVSTIAGTPGVAGSSDGFGGAARFYGAYGLAVDASGNVFIADANNNVIRKGVPVVLTAPSLTWPAPPELTYPGVLTSAHLNATANVPGTFTYSNSVGQSVEAGVRTLTATFTPSDQDIYSIATVQTNIVVRKYTPKIYWPTIYPMAYGTSLTAEMLGAVPEYGGTITYTPALGSVLGVGTHTITLTYTPTDAVNLNSVTVQQVVTVNPTPTNITWANPGSLTYGAALSNAELNATADTAGTFVYSPALGTVLNAGIATLTATFTPNNARYSGASAQVILYINPARPTVTWAQPADVPGGTALSSAQLNATASVPGTFTYLPANGVVLGGGNHLLQLTFIPADATNYTSVNEQRTLTVLKATPVLSWPAVASITYGQPLSKAELNATCNVAGTIEYAPALGSILHAGGTLLSATFHPDEPASYESAILSRSITVSKAVLTAKAADRVKLQGAENPSMPVEYSGFIGSDSAAVLDAVPSTATTVTAASPAGIYPITISGGSDADYTLLLKNGTLTVASTAVPPAITNSDGPRFIVGETGAFTFNTTGTPSPTLTATGLPPWANLDPNTGVLTGTPTSIAGSPFTIAVSATNGVNSSTTVNFTLTVDRATPAIVWPGSPTGIVYGARLDSKILNATSSVPGTFAYKPAAGVVLDAGSNQTLNLTFTPTDGSYSTVSKSILISVAKAPLTAKAVDKAKVQGTVSPTFTIEYSGFVNGDTAGVLDVAPTANSTATTDAAIGTYVITPSGGSDNNYSVQLVPGTLSVTTFSVAPTFTSSATATFLTGQFGSFSVQATGTPAPIISVTGLPAWAALNPTTGVVSGTPSNSTGSPYQLVFTANNGIGTGAVQNFTLVVKQAAEGNYVGTYFGTIAGGRGNWALRVNGDNTAVYIAYLAQRGSAIVVQLTIDSDGQFTATGSETVPLERVNNIRLASSIGSPPTKAAAASSSFILKGRITGGAVAGQFAGLDEAFSGAIDSGSGAAASGYYSAVAQTGAGGTYAIVSSSGQALVVAVSSTALDAATGVVASNGQLSVTTATGGQIAVSVSAGNSSLAATFIPAGSSTPINYGSSTGGGLPSTGARLVNLSVRSRAGTGDKTLIMGFVISGSGTKQVLARGIGPTLIPFGVTGALVDPMLRLYSSTGQIDSNDNWSGSTSMADTFSALGATALTPGSKDAALVRGMTEAAYSAHVATTDGTTGIALAEIYDADKKGARLVNVSARCEAGSRDDVLVAGFVLEGTGSRTLLIRGLGPTLGALGVNGALPDPELKLFNQAGVQLMVNDDWGGAAALKSAFASLGAAALVSDSSKDSALLVTLESGVYSAQVSGVNNATGVALVEIYEVP